MAAANSKSTSTASATPSAADPVASPTAARRPSPSQYTGVKVATTRTASGIRSRLIHVPPRNVSTMPVMLPTVFDTLSPQPSCPSRNAMASGMSTNTSSTASTQARSAGARVNAE